VRGGPQALTFERGYAVLVTGRNPDTIAAARHALPADIVVFRADAHSIADAEALAAELRRRFGDLRLAFLNAGVAQLTSLDTREEETYVAYAKPRLGSLPTLT
jgi:NADP-dependent 3-hydroxy acid dehydrogenase YdfG